MEKQIKIVDRAILNMPADQNFMSQYNRVTLEQVKTVLQNWKMQPIEKLKSGKITFIPQKHLRKNQIDFKEALQCQLQIKKYISKGKLAHVDLYLGEGYETYGDANLDNMAESITASQGERWLSLGKPFECEGTYDFHLKNIHAKAKKNIDWYWGFIGQKEIFFTDNEPMVRASNEFLIKDLKSTRFFGTLIKAVEEANKGKNVAIIWGNAHEKEYLWFMQRVGAEPEVLRVAKSCQAGL